MNFEQSHQELVKCVVVGDTAVGKTRLICAKACNLILDLSQLMTTHIPTVWAIDQYRIHKEVLERSWEVVDGVNVSLRLWDTFGDHDKDRRFAYGRSDVVLLCFSISNPLSLRNCKTVWYPEIRKFCPNTPIVLVGCKNDLRYMFRDEKFQNLCREKSPFFRANHLCCRFPDLARPLKECDILSPEQGRAVAKEINASYYETSVFTSYGVKEVFENVIRAALISRRQQRFLMTSLRHVRGCFIQEPFLPPKPQLLQIKVPNSQYTQDIWSLLSKQAYTDVVFVNNQNVSSSSSNTMHCHKIVLIAASEMFNTLFTYHHYNQGKTHFWTCIDRSINEQPTETLFKCASDISIVSSLSNEEDLDKHKLLFNDDSQIDVRFNHVKHFFSASSFIPILTDTSKLFKHSFAKHKLFAPSYPTHNKIHHSKQKFKFLQQKLITVYRNIRNYRLDGIGGSILKSKSQSIISFKKNIPFEALKTYISILYSLSTKYIDLENINIRDLLKCLRFLDLIDFDVGYLQHQQKNCLDSYSTEVFLKRLEHHVETKSEVFSRRLAFFGIEKGLFFDVIFKLEDGTCYGHKAILMARCEVLEAMFKGDFKESLAQMIVFPDITKETFFNMLFYIYTDQLIESITHKNCLSLIELANRFCLIRLIGLIEERVVNELLSISLTSDCSTMSKSKTDIGLIVLKLLEPCQIHNADQLSDFCLHYITTHYNDICHNYSKQLRALHPENQAYLNRNRWPPTWYIKEHDYFERCVREREWQENPKSFKRHKLNAAGCFCFSPKSKAHHRDGRGGSGSDKRQDMLTKLNAAYTPGLTYRAVGIM